MPAQWSEKAVQERIKEKNAAHIAEVKALFKKFRDGGWMVSVADVYTKERKPDDWIGYYCLFVKMPGAAEMQINTISQLRRLVLGV